MSKPRQLLAPTLILLAGAAARIAPLTDNRFHPDEALYASYGRLISTYDWNLASRLVDKPPLAFYLLAGSFMRVGPNEVAARLPNLAASLLSLALVWRLAMRLWGRRDAALLAMLFCALSPMAILFSPTAFTDPLLVVWVLAALVAVTGGRWGWAGLFFGLALATKQTALLFLPLVVGVGLLSQMYPVGARHASPLLRVLRFVLPNAVVICLLVAWDATRPGVTGFWRAGVMNNAPAGLARPEDLWPRLRAWLGWLQYVGGWPPASGAIVLALLGVPGCHLLRRQSAGRALPDLSLWGFVLAFLALYWLVAFNIYDRYMLPLVPLVALLLGRAITCALPERGALAALLLAGLLAVPAANAARSRYPVGGDHGAYDGIDELADYLDALPDETVIYDHWLGWPLDFYLFDSPAYTTYFATPADLMTMLRQQPGDQSAVLLLPAWVDADAVFEAVTAAGCRAIPAYENANRFGDSNLLAFTLSPENE